MTCVGLASLDFSRMSAGANARPTVTGAGTGARRAPWIHRLFLSALVAGLPIAPAQARAQVPAFITAWHVANPEDVAVDAAGNVYVTEDGNLVQEFTSAGVLIRQWGTAGSGSGQFNGPTGIAV